MRYAATVFAEAGFDVAIVDIATAEAAAKKIAETTGRKVIALKCDVTDEAQVQTMVDAVVRQLGGLNFCHANAGTQRGLLRGRRQPCGDSAWRQRLFEVYPENRGCGHDLSGRHPVGG